MRSKIIKDFFLKLENSKYVNVYYLFIPFLLLLSLQPLAISPFYVKAFSSGILHGIVIILAELFIFYMLGFLILAIVNRIFAATLILGIFTYTFFIVNYYRSEITTVGLIPADFALAKGLGSIIGFTKLWVNKNIIVSFLFLLLIMVVTFLLRKAYKPIKLIRTRVVFLLVPITVLYFGASSQFGRNQIAKILNVNPELYCQHPNKFYDQYGTLSGFYLLMQEENYGALQKDQQTEALSVAKLQNDVVSSYDKEYLQYVYSTIENDIIPESENGIKPDVIVILSESFWDPTGLENIEFSQDPIPNFRKLEQTHTTGTLISPAFGGLTSNVEYEVLTGKPICFLPPNAVPFEAPDEFIPEDSPTALPHQFADNGYKTVAISPFQRNFYNRDKIYPRLGFEEYISIEQMEDPSLKGGLISDAYFTDQIISQLEKADKPAFIYGVSIQNHYEYFPDKYDENNIRVQESALDMMQTKSMETYLQGINDADKELQRLLDYLEKRDKPTVVFFFGDHLPLISRNAMTLYNRLGYTSKIKAADWDVEDNQKMYATKYLLWTNFETKDFPMDTMSSFYAGAGILEVAGIPKSKYSNFLLAQYPHYKALQRYMYVNQDDTVSSEPLWEDEKELRKFFYLNYDLSKDGEKVLLKPST